jgi:hypothetical protein
MKSSRKKAPGRKPEHLKIEGDWRSAVGRALRRGKPKAAKGKRKKGK